MAIPSRSGMIGTFPADSAVGGKRQRDDHRVSPEERHTAIGIFSHHRCLANGGDKDFVFKHGVLCAEEEHCESAFGSYLPVDECLGSAGMMTMCIW
jgi:hypothetical protein